MDRLPRQLIHEKWPGYELKELSVVIKREKGAYNMSRKAFAVKVASWVNEWMNTLMRGAVDVTYIRTWGLTPGKFPASSIRMVMLHHVSRGSW
jgi:hypothetical protein